MANKLWNQIGLNALGVVGDQISTAVQYGRTKKLMGIQQQNQMALNEQGRELQMQTWKDTNYPAQMEMIKTAGLNPALLYGKGGAGGATTGSQSGGSASMGSAPQSPKMDISSIMQMKLMEKQAELLEAERKKVEAETPNTAGVQQADIEAKKAGANKSKADADYVGVQTKIAEIQLAKTSEQITAGIENVKADTKKKIAEGTLTEQNMPNIIKETQLKAVGQELENALTQSKTRLTDMERQAIITGLVQKWTELSQKERALGQTDSAIAQRDKEIEIEKFKSEMAQKYPSVMNVAGGFIQGALNQLRAIGEWYNPGVFEISDKKPK